MTAKKLPRIDESSLPTNWKVATLADVTEYIQRGKGPKYIDRSNLPVINQKCIRWFGIQKEHLKYVDPEQWSSWGEERYVRLGDVLWNSTGTGTIGRAAIIRSLAPGEKYVVDSHVTIVRPRNIDPQYVHYWIMSPSVQGSIEAMQSGSTNQVELSKSAVEALPIPVAPQEQQKRIVAEIEKQFSRLDEAVADLKRVKANLKRYKASILKAAVEGKLTEDWRKQHPNVEPASKLLERILVERRAKWSGKVKCKELVSADTSKLPALPERWAWCITDALFSYVTSGSRGWAQHYSVEGPLFLRIGNLDHDSIRLDLRDVQRVKPPEGTEGTRTKVEEGDILVSITADVGMIALAPPSLGEAYINQHVALARPVNEICREYLAWYLAARDGGQKEFRRLQRGATKAGLGLDDIRAVPVSLPPLAEQQ